MENEDSKATLVLVGASGYDYADSLRSCLENWPFVWSAWSFKIRQEWRETISDLLKTKGKFPVFFCIGTTRGGSGLVEYVASATQVLMGDVPAPSPDIDHTNLGEEAFPTERFKSYTWFRFEKVDPIGPFDLGNSVNADSEEPVIYNQLVNAFAYAHVIGADTLETLPKSQYWLCITTLENWEECLKTRTWGATDDYEQTLGRIAVNDILIVYAKRFKLIGTCRVSKTYFYDEKRIWRDKIYPHRINFEPCTVPPKPVDIDSLYKDSFPDKDASGYFRKSVRELPKAEADKFIEFLSSAPEKSYFIFRTGGGEYRDVPAKTYHFREGIPGSVQVLDAERNGEFVYYQGDKGGFWGKGHIGEVGSGEEDGVKQYFVDVEGFLEFPEPRSMQSLRANLTFDNVSRAGIQKITREDYDTIVGEGSIEDSASRVEFTTLTEKLCLADLIAGKNLILYGPPGTGKTRLAKELAKAFCGEQGFSFVTANAEWNAYNVIGGDYISGEGGLSTSFRAGFLTNAALEGRKGPFWVVIDELNRANLDLAFGEAFTLLDIEHRAGAPLVQKTDHPGLESDVHLPARAALSSDLPVSFSVWQCMSLRNLGTRSCTLS